MTSSGKLRTISGHQKLEQQQIASESVSPDCFKCGSSQNRSSVLVCYCKCEDPDPFLGTVTLMD